MRGKNWRRISTYAFRCSQSHQKLKTAPQFMAALKQCTKARDLEGGKKLHREAFAAGFNTDRFLAAVIIGMYSKCRRMELAQQVFDGLKHPDVVTWNCLIRGYADNGNNAKAIRILASMTCDPDSFTLVAALKACSGLALEAPSQRPSCLDKASDIHKRIQERGFGSNLVVANTLVDAYGKCGSMKRAREVFDTLVKKDVYSWTSLIVGYVENGENDVAVELFTSMDCQPDSFTYAAALKACAGLATSGGESKKRLSLQRAIEIHARARNGGFLSDTVVANALLDLYSKCGSVKHAEEVFDGVARKDFVTWTCMINGYVTNGESSKALDTFFSMNSVPDPHTYVVALKACTALAAEEESEKESCLQKGIAIHKRVSEQGLTGDTFVASAVVNMYSKLGCISRALEVFKTMPRKDVVTWNCLILGCVENSQSSLATELFRKMDCEPDSFTYSAALKASGSLAAVSAGKVIHAKLCRSGMEGNQVVATSLSDFYAKCGCIDKAQALFDAMDSPDIVSWNTMVAGYTSLGDSSRAVGLFGEIHDAGLHVDDVTFVSVLTACSHGGRVDDGSRYFNSMSKYGVSPTLDHYNCMVDMLGRANRIKEALAVIEGMSLKPDKVTWMTLLGACRKWKNLQTGRLAFDRLVSMGEDTSAAYVVIGDIYRSLGMSSDWQRTEEQRRNQTAWKEPGRSWWCDSEGQTVEFVVGDETSKEVGEKLAEVLRGYESQGGDESLCGHSEKLAVAYALLHTAPHQPIRIVKNLRVCVDCHGATSHISKSEKREIIIRDASRFHVFRDGVCSCGDCW